MILFEEVTDFKMGLWSIYLHHVGPDLLLVTSTLELHNLKDTGGQGVVIHSR